MTNRLLVLQAVSRSADPTPLTPRPEHRSFQLPPFALRSGTSYPGSRNRLRTGAGRCSEPSALHGCGPCRAGLDARPSSTGSRSPRSCTLGRARADATRERFESSILAKEDH